MVFFQVLCFFHNNDVLFSFSVGQETTPLAGSSAGAIVCAVIASGASMQEALEATKMLAEDCRLRGTAFRLGVLHVPLFILRDKNLDL